MIFAEDVTVHSLQIFPDSSFPTGFNFLTGQFKIFDSSDTELFDSGSQTFDSGFVKVEIDPAISGARKVLFIGITWESIEPGFGEFAIAGTVP